MPCRLFCGSWQYFWTEIQRSLHPFPPNKSASCQNPRNVIHYDNIFEFSPANCFFFLGASTVSSEESLIKSESEEEMQMTWKVNQSVIQRWTGPGQVHEQPVTIMTVMRRTLSHFGNSKALGKLKSHHRSTNFVLV